MTRRLSFITAVAVAALSVGAPAAFGKGQPVLAQPDPMIEDGFAQAVAKKLSVTGIRDAHERAVASESSAVEYFKANELATLVQSGESALTGYRDAFERGNVAANRPGVATYRDSFERAELPRGSVPVSVATYRDSFERTDLPRESVPVSITTSSRDIEWPQIGVGFGIGLLLALGLGLTMRAVHSRPFAH